MGAHKILHSHVCHPSPLAMYAVKSCQEIDGRMSMGPRALPATDLHGHKRPKDVGKTTLRGRDGLDVDGKEMGLIKLLCSRPGGGGSSALKAIKNSGKMTREMDLMKLLCSRGLPMPG